MNRKLEPAELAQVQNAFDLVIKFLTANTNKDCITCAHFNNGCNLAGGAMPPEDVQEKGCSSYVNNSIPF